MFKTTTAFLFCASVLIAQENLSLSQQLQDIDKEEESLLSSLNQIKEDRELIVLTQSNMENNTIEKEVVQNNEVAEKRFAQVVNELETIQNEVEEEKKSEEIKTKQALMVMQEKKALEESALAKQRIDQKKMAELFLVEKNKFDKIESDNRKVQEHARQRDEALEKEAKKMEETVRAELHKKAEAKKMAALFLIEKKKYDKKEAQINKAEVSKKIKPKKRASSKKSSAKKKKEAQAKKTREANALRKKQEVAKREAIKKAEAARANEKNTGFDHLNSILGS